MVVVTVHDIEPNGPPLNPTGMVSISSSVASDVLASGCALAPSDGDAGMCSLTIQALDNSVHLVSGSVPEGQFHGASNGSAGLTVNNLPPVITGVNGPSSPLALGTAAAITANFVDPGVLDTHTCAISWDDGATTPGVVSEVNGSRTCSGNRAYAGTGVYPVTVTVLDDDGGNALSRFEFVVVYDPTAGFVTGGGWINSLAGAYVSDPGLTGRASFGFVSKYKKGMTVPTGETQFQFQLANLNFHSAMYEWLVVSGARSQYKGTGTVNGSGDYGFLLTATDGQISGGGGTDKFRIKIWDRVSGTTVYDNVPGAADDLNNASPQVIGGGSIVIHAK